MLARPFAVETAHAPWPQHPPAWPVGLGIVPPPRAGHATANQTNAGRPAAARRGLASGSKPGSGIWSSGVAAGGQWPVVVPTNVGGGAARRSRPHCSWGRRGPWPRPPSKAARPPKLALTCRTRRPQHASRPMAQAIAVIGVPELDGWREGVVGTINPFSERLQSEPKPKLPVKSPLYNLRLAKCLRLMA